MNLTRRSLLKSICAAGAIATAGPGQALARPYVKPSEDAVAMLYDATKCIGCKTCMVACKEANDLPPETTNALWENPQDLSGSTKTIIKLFREGDQTSYMKAQCMHCVDPACVSVCMIGALHKGKYGVVEYDAARCVGCRYCQIACPFDVPKFQWNAAFSPKIVKCEMCAHRLKEGKEPACTEVCPTKAVKFGKRADLLAEARERIRQSPDKYVPKIYGEKDAGGTQALYLSAIPFEKLGLPNLSNEPVPHVSETVQHGVYKGFIAPVTLYALLSGVLYRNRRSKVTDVPPDQNQGKEATP